MVTMGLETTRVFSTADRSYSWADVIAAAREWGEWQSLERDVRAALGADAGGSATAVAPARAELTEAASEWRYERNLLAAEELKRWLSRWEISVSDWSAYIRQSVILAKDPAASPGFDRESVTVSEEFDRATWARAVCSGRLWELARRLADQVAVERSLRGQDAAPDDAPLALAHSHELLERFARDHVTDDALRAAIRANGLGLTRITLHYLAHERLDVLREAALGVTEDSRGFDEVARDAGLATDELSLLLEDAEPSLRTRLLAANPGELVGPFPISGQHWLVLVVDRVLPSIDDEALRDRARKELLDRALRVVVARNINWHEHR
jgi:hypothetical protein